MAFSRKIGVKPRGRLKEAFLQPYRKTGLGARRLRLIGERVSSSLAGGAMTPGAGNGLKLLSLGIFLSLTLAGMLFQPLLPEAEIAPFSPAPPPTLSKALEVSQPAVRSRASIVKRTEVVTHHEAASILKPKPKLKPNSKPNGEIVQMQENKKEPKSTAGTLAIQLGLYKSGLAFFEDEEWEDATRAFHTIIINYPQSPLKAESLYRVVLGLSFQGKCQEALRYFKEVEQTSSIAEVHRLRVVLSRCNSPKALSSP